MNAERELLVALARSVQLGTIEFEFDDRTEARVGAGEPRTRLRWSDAAVRRALTEGTVGFCDAWVCGQWQVVEGTLLDALRGFGSANLQIDVKRRVPRVLAAKLALGHLGASATAAWRARSVRSHYDLDEDFYRLWLDEELVYTCGYALQVDDDLDTMQRQKLELVCSKLRLEGSHRLLDLGCGWGGLALHAAASRGAHVTAVNLSRPQLTTLERRAGERGLRGRIDIVHGDLAEARGTFDRVAAIGVAEHMGRAGLATLFRVVEARLATGGIGLVHTIGSATTGGTDPWLERTIFPGSYVPTLSELVRASEDAGLRVVHVENLGTHYALTLRHWLRRFREHDDVVRRRYGERFRREWEMYLTMLVPTFELLSTGLYQLVVTKGAAALDPRDVRTHCGALHAPRGSA